MEELLGMKSPHYCARATAGLVITRCSFSQSTLDLLMCPCVMAAAAPSQLHNVSPSYQKSVTLNVFKHQTNCLKLQPAQTAANCDRHHVFSTDLCVCDSSFFYIHSFFFLHVSTQLQCGAVFASRRWPLRFDLK